MAGPYHLVITRITGFSVPSPGLAAQLACIIEVTARKPGNVHPGQGFADASYIDFLVSAAAIAPVLDGARARGSLGGTILGCVEATRAVTRSNTNLGIILLLSPLAHVAPGRLRDPAGVAGAIEEVLGATTMEDAELAYEAIRLAAPGGLGRSAKADVMDGPTGTLLEMMVLAAERDLVARQYATAYADAREGARRLEALLTEGVALGDAVVRVFLELIARHGDTLIERKLGKDVSLEAARRAREVLETAPGPAAEGRLAAFDAWLREDSNRRNPGACADVTAAILYLGILAGRIQLPFEAMLHANV